MRRSPEEGHSTACCNNIHYLGYTQPVGEQLKFMVCAESGPVALFAWSSAARHLGPRDRYLDGRRGAPPEHSLSGLQHALPHLPVGPGAAPGLASVGADDADAAGGVAEGVWPSGVFCRDIRGHHASPRHVLPRGELGFPGPHTRPRQGRSDSQAQPNLKDVLGLPLVRDFREQLLSA